MDLQAIAIVFEFMHPGSTAGRALGDDRPAGMDETRRRIHWPPAKVARHGEDIWQLTPKAHVERKALEVEL